MYPNINARVACLKQHSRRNQFFFLVKSTHRYAVLRLHTTCMNYRVAWLRLWSTPTLVWPQWWSFADVSQQGVDFSKKISKRKIFFWFDLHRCSHGLSKSASIWLSKSIFYVKNHWNLSDFFFIEEYQFRSRFFVIFEPLCFLKWCPIFWRSV